MVSLDIVLLTSRFPREMQGSERNRTEDFRSARLIRDDDMIVIEPACRPDLPAMKGCRYFDTKDVDEARSLLSDVFNLSSLETITRSTVNRFRMEMLNLGRLRIGALRFGHAKLDLDQADDYYMVMFCVSGKATITITHEIIVINQNNGVCASTGKHFSAELSGDCELLFLRIDPTLMRFCERKVERQLGLELDLTSPALKPFISALNTILWEHETVDIIKSEASVAATYEELCVLLLLSGQGLSDSGPGTSIIAPACVRRAEIFMQERFYEPLRIEDVVQASGVPMRTLYQNFLRFRGSSPMRYLRDVRLNRAKSELSKDTDATISSLAMDAGFRHLGRFAHDYWKMFGETPSQTRERCRGKCT